MKATMTLGKMSTFGGPHDSGVAASEGLALIEPVDLAHWWYHYLFLPQQPEGTTGLARRLNPMAYYCAMRFDYDENSRHELRHSFVRLRNPRTGKNVFARPVDWGPNARTNRVIDISPGAAAVLCLTTDDHIEAFLIEPSVNLAP